MIRNTYQQEIIYKAVCVLDHPTAQEVYEKIKIDNPTIGRVTVFRNLDKLVSLGKLLKLQFPKDSCRYDAKMLKHVHLKCKKCGRIVDVEDALVLDDKFITEFQIESHFILFEGVCKECQKK